MTKQQRSVRAAQHRAGRPDTYQRAAYIAAALQQAVYRPYADGTIYGEIPALRGVLANEPTRAACEAELAAVLDSWITARFRRRLPIPVLAGIDRATWEALR
ncbi:MAG TPA: type II toxin-antitoxin system HicB family antitoxin [Chloroflexia bacterium]|nr:type II toxin-antitoxin system HicB family antitoxin [Chloroflexia bacterium]